MPVCFQLYPKNNPQEAEKLPEVDNKMCAHFQVEPDPVQYWLGWFDCVGFRLATGKSFDQIREEFRGYVGEDSTLTDRERSKGAKEYYEKMLEIVDWLDANYTPNSFYSPFK